MRKNIIVALCGAALTLGAACSAPKSERLGTDRAAGSTAFPNDQTAYDYFRGKGFTSFQAAGIVGNLDQESGIDPTISQTGGGPGRGIAQWSAGGRWDTDQGDNLVAFATQAGQSPDTLGVQLDFIMYELQTFPAYGLAKLQATSNVTDATTDFELDFEGCGIPAQCDANARISYAQAVLAAYGNDPVQADAGSQDGDTASEAGGSQDGGGIDSGASDAGAHVGGDAAPPAQPGDAGAPLGTSDSGATGDAGGTAAAATSQGWSGCAVATAGAASRARGVWLTAIGLALGITLRRRRHDRNPGRNRSRNVGHGPPTERASFRPSSREESAPRGRTCSRRPLGG